MYFCKLCNLCGLIVCIYLGGFALILDFRGLIRCLRWICLLGCYCVLFDGLSDVVCLGLVFLFVTYSNVVCSDGFIP